MRRAQRRLQIGRLLLPLQWQESLLQKSFTVIAANQESSLLPCRPGFQGFPDPVPPQAAFAKVTRVIEFGKNLKKQPCSDLITSSTLLTQPQIVRGGAQGLKMALVR
jgi:hypothetical protein